MATTIMSFDPSVREDLLNVITNISPRETQLMSGLGTTTAAGVDHNWLEDTLETAKINSRLEGADSSFTVINATRDRNFCQIIAQGYMVSDTMKAENTAGYADALAYQASKAMAMWKNDAEYSVLLGSITTGATGATARLMKGVANWVVATNICLVSGISLSEDQMVDYLQRVWNYGGQVDEIYVGATLKKRIDGFTANSTRNMNQEDKRLVNAIDVYESSFAPVVKIFLHRYIDSHASLLSGQKAILGIQNEHLKVAYLRKPQIREISRTGDAVKGEVIGELTVEARSGGKTSFLGLGYI